MKNKINIKRSNKKNNQIKINNLETYDNSN